MIRLVNIEEVARTIKVARSRKYTRQKLIENIQQWAKEHDGRIPRYQDFRNNQQFPSTQAYISEFGTWNNSLEAAELGVNKDIYTIQQLIEKMQQWAKEHDELPPTTADFTNNPKYPSVLPYIKQFGSWNNAKMAAGFKPNDETTRSRQGELQTLSEFKTHNAVDLSGVNRQSPCDGICPKGEFYDVKSASLSRNVNGAWGWKFNISEIQLEEADYLFLRAYEDKDFTKSPKHKWRIPIELCECRKRIFIYKDDKGIYNIKNMKEYEIL